MGELPYSNSHIYWEDDPESVTLVHKAADIILKRLTPFTRRPETTFEVSCVMRNGSALICSNVPTGAKIEMHDKAGNFVEHNVTHSVFIQASWFIEGKHAQGHMPLFFLLGSKEPKLLSFSDCPQNDVDGYADRAVRFFLSAAMKNKMLSPKAV